MTYTRVRKNKITFAISLLATILIPLIMWGGGHALTVVALQRLVVEAEESRGILKGSGCLVIHGAIYKLQRFIGADVFARIVPLVTIRLYGEVPPPRPVVCDRAVRTSMKASAFFDDLDDSSCKLYEFKNLARKEVLQVYRGSAHSQKAHFFCLQTVKLE